MDDDTSAPLVRPDPPRSWRDRVESVADATGVTPARLVLGAALAALAVAGALWLLRPPAAPVEVALPFASSTTSLEPPAPSSTEATSVLVHVAGAVAVPGVHELPAGSRVVDAIDVAGGLAPQADGARLNLAAPINDGERVYVLAVGEVAAPTVPGGTGAGPAGPDGGPGPVPLNTADETALEALPGVGPATAAAIVEHRERIGGFTSVDQLIEVRGIGEAKLEQLRPHVSI